MNDPTQPVTLPAWLLDLERRVTEIERANPIARSSFHDGTYTRGQIGNFVHPVSALDTVGMHLTDDAGVTVFLVSDDGLEVPAPGAGSGDMTAAVYDAAAKEEQVITTGDNAYLAGGTDVPVTDGGTGSSTASAARTALGLLIGTDVQAWAAVLDATTASFLVADETKLDGIEALADVTDATNVTAAGAHMAAGTDVPITDGGTGSSTAGAARTALGVDATGTDNSIDVTLAGTPDYLTLAGQVLTRGLIDLSTDVTGSLPSLTAYDYVVIWAEEAGGLGSGAGGEWSYGNGATGDIGVPLPIGNGETWDLVEQGCHVDAASASSTVVIAVTNHGTTMDSGAATSLNTETFTQGSAAQIALGTPVTGVAGGSVIGFSTGTLTGTMSDARVSAVFRQAQATVAGAVI